MHLAQRGIFLTRLVLRTFFFALGRLDGVVIACSFPRVAVANICPSKILVVSVPVVVLTTCGVVVFTTCGVLAVMKFKVVSDEKKFKRLRGWSFIFFVFFPPTGWCALLIASQIGETISHLPGLGHAAHGRNCFRTHLHQHPRICLHAPSAPTQDSWRCQSECWQDSGR